MPQAELIDSTLLVNLDDSKANAVGHTLIDGVNDALDRAESEAKAVVLAGRDGMFSAGFDLNEFKKGAEATEMLVSRGGKLLLRLFEHPQPVVAACTGHAVAAGGFMLLASDTRVGTRGAFKLGLNETAIGMTLPVFGLELASARLSKRHLTAAVIQARLFEPEEAVDAGFLDELVEAGEVRDRALELAAQLGELPGHAYANNKRLIRANSITRIRDSL